jgi:hypothetical protein
MGVSVDRCDEGVFPGRLQTSRAELNEEIAMEFFERALLAVCQLEVWVWRRDRRGGRIDEGI